MKTTLCVALFALVCASAASSKAEVTPVQKVIQLLTGMAEKGKKEKHEEQVQFAAYRQFCEDNTVEKKRSVEEAAAAIGTLKANIQSKNAKAAKLTKDIAGLDADVATWTGDQKAATSVRNIEKADYDKTHQDYSESISAMENAINVLRKGTGDRKQASLLQVSSLKRLSLIPAGAKKAIDAFVQQSANAEDEQMDAQMEAYESGAPEANAYESQSSGVVDMLKNLNDKFIEERTTLEKEEANSKHAFTMLIQDLSAQVDQAKKDRDANAESKSKAMQASAEKSGNLQDTTSTMNEDQKYLDDLVATCTQKASDFENRQQLRAEEITASEKALAISSGGAVSGAADKHLPSLLQTKKSAFLQLGADASVQATARVAVYLHKRSRQLNSRVLATAASQASANPMAKVTKMIKGLIVKLMEEANAESDHKGWCDTEMSTNQQTRTEKSDAVETLRAEIDELTASIAKMEGSINGLTKAVADLDAAMAEATNLRQAEKDKNTATIADADAAQAAVAQALTVLKEFYAKAGEATTFLQAPEVFDSSYNGMGSESGGVVGMLEVIESDFSRLEADTKASEASAAKEYDTFMTDSKVDKTTKSTSIDHKTAKKQDQSQTLTIKNEDLEGTQKELDSALVYFDKLKPSCVDSGVSYEDRVARRKEEIESMQEALKIMNGEDIA